MPLRANSSRQNLHILLTPDVLLWFNEILQGVSGQISGRLRAFRAKTIWPPMFSYVSWKCHFSQTIVFLRYNMKIGVISQGKNSKNFCKHKIVFWDFCKIAIAIEMKWMCFCHFWKCGHFSLTDTRCFIMPNCIKNTIFVNLCGGIQRCTFKLASMYYMRQFLITLSYWNISKSIRKKIKDLIFIIKKY